MLLPLPPPYTAVSFPSKATIMTSYSTKDITSAPSSTKISTNYSTNKITSISVSSSTIWTS